MSPIERFIIRHKAARYAFVLFSFPIVAARDELARLRHYRPETGMADLHRALSWARVGGVPGRGDRTRPEPAPVHPKWQSRPADPGPFAEVIDPCFDCGDAKDDHRDGRCVGDFLHCPCKEWHAGQTESDTGFKASGGAS